MASSAFLDGHQLWQSSTVYVLLFCQGGKSPRASESYRSAAGGSRRRGDALRGDAGEMARKFKARTEGPDDGVSFFDRFTIFCWLRKGFQLVPVMGINGGLTVVKMIGDFFVFQHISQPGIYHPTISSTFRIELFLSFKVVFQPHFGLFSVNFLACKSLYQ